MVRFLWSGLKQAAPRKVNVAIGSPDGANTLVLLRNAEAVLKGGDV